MSLVTAAISVDLIIASISMDLNILEISHLSCDSKSNLETCIVLGDNWTSISSYGNAYPVIE